MAFSAIDANVSLTAHAAALASAGIKRVGRYLSHNPQKNLTRTEALALGVKGIGCWMVWETTQGRALAGTDAGTEDARDAIKQAADIGAPKGAGIYFAVDMDATDSQIAGPINDYFTAVKAAIGANFIPGVYGNGAACAWCLDHHLTQLTWVWAGRLTNGTTNFLASDRWNLHQHVPVEAGAEGDFLNIGVGFDPDDFKENCGAFLLTNSGATLLGAQTAPTV